MGIKPYLNGKVCRSKRTGCVGLVMGTKTLKQGESYVGLSLDPHHPNKPNRDALWASRNPKVIADSIGEYYAQILVTPEIDEVRCLYCGHLHSEADGFS